MSATTKRVYHYKTVKDNFKKLTTSQRKAVADISEAIISKNESGHPIPGVINVRKVNKFINDALHSLDGPKKRKAPAKKRKAPAKKPKKRKATTKKPKTVKTEKNSSKKTAPPKKRRRTALNKQQLEASAQVAKAAKRFKDATDRLDAAEAAKLAASAAVRAQL